VLFLVSNDADPDGDAIFCSLLSFFSAWPDLFKQSRIYRVRSPLYVCQKKGKKKLFYTYEEFQKAKLDSSWEVNYIKGLGSLDQEDYAEVINNPVLVKVSALDDQDINMIDIAFGDSSDERKKWMLE